MTGPEAPTDPDPLAHLRRRLRVVTVLAVLGLVLGPITGAVTGLLMNTPGPRGQTGSTGPQGIVGPQGAAGQDGVSISDPALQAMVRNYAVSAAMAASQNCFPVTVVTSVSFYAGAFGSPISTTTADVCRAP